MPGPGLVRSAGTGIGKDQCRDRDWKEVPGPGLVRSAGTGIGQECRDREWSGVPGPRDW